MEALLIGSSVLILFVILLRAVFGRYISFRVRYALWLIVVLRLAWPFSLPGSPYSIMNYVPSVQDLSGQGMEQQKSAEPYGGGGLSAGENGERNGFAQGETGEPAMLTARQGAAVTQADVRTQAIPVKNTSMQQSQQNRQDNAAMRNVRAAALEKGLIVIWLTGAVLMSLYLLIVNMTWYLRLRRTRVLIQSADRAKEGRTIPVYRCEKLASPCLFGVWRPAVYLNDTALADEKNRVFALAHEQQHYRHKDHIWSFVRLLCLTVYWFHPLVWAAAVLSARDCELACDEGVTARITDEECAEYGRSLLSQVPLKRGGMNLTMNTSMSGSARNLKRRLVAIMYKKKNSVWAAFLMTIILLLVTGCTFTGAEDHSSTAAGSSVDNPGTKEGEIGMGESDVKASSDEGLLSQLKESIRIDEYGRLTFRIPVNDHTPEDWSISIYGKERMSGQGIVIAYFVGGNKTCVWESGSTFPIIDKEDLSNVSELSMTVELSSFSEDGEKIKTSMIVDLLERYHALSGAAEDESMMQTALQAFTMLPDGCHGWALTKDGQVLYTYEGVEQFSCLNHLPYAEAGEFDDGTARFRADTETGVSSCFLDEKTAFFAGVSADEGEALLIRETIMSVPAAEEEDGRVAISQHSTRIPLKEYFPNGNIYVSFSDSEHGYLLVCSDPAGGLMSKHLYQTLDGGDSFSFVADLSGMVTGYPAGMAFCGAETGYIGVSHRGEPAYLYGTQDGGKTWQSLSLPIYADAAYADGLSPVLFYAEGKAQAAVVLKNVSTDSVWYVLYENHNAAETLDSWELIRILSYDEVRSYSPLDESTGYFIDGDGMLHKWKYELP